MYEVKYYWADGCSGPSGTEPAPHGQRFDSLLEATAAVEAVVPEIDDQTWSGDDGDIIAYHESSDDGCGGFSIRQCG